MSMNDYNSMTKAEQQGEDFMTKNWRPMMAVTYMLTCLFDFIVGPILYNILQFYNPGQHLDMWQPLTLQGGGLYHIAMGVVLGITAHGRTQEKINGVETPSPIGGMMNMIPSMPKQESYTQPMDSSKFGKSVPQPEDPLL